MQLSLLNESTHEVSFLKKESSDGKAVLKWMYGPYDSIILNNEFEISTPTSAEFTLPQFSYKNKAYILREHPGLRYKLWKRRSPDVILLGSSIFFCDFSRQAFFARYPNKYLLDFTTGNNTPFIASWFMKFADSLGLEFKPGTIVLYGMNRVEMLASYKDSNAHDYVKQAIAGRPQKLTLDKAVEQFLHFPELRYDLTTTLKDKYNLVFRSSGVYRVALLEKYLVNENALISYIKDVAPVNTTVHEFDAIRVREIEKLADFLQQRHCRLALLKLPQSLYNDVVLNTRGYSWFDGEMKKLDRNITYVDVSNLATMDLTQLDYIWPGNIFDPEHLNHEGAQKFTHALMQQVLNTMLRKPTITH